MACVKLKNIIAYAKRSSFTIIRDSYFLDNLFSGHSHPFFLTEHDNGNICVVIFEKRVVKMSEFIPKQALFFEKTSYHCSLQVSIRDSFASNKTKYQRRKIRIADLLNNPP